MSSALGRPGRTYLPVGGTWARSTERPNDTDPVAQYGRAAALKTAGHRFDSGRVHEQSELPARLVRTTQPGARSAAVIAARTPRRDGVTARRDGHQGVHVACPTGPRPGRRRLTVRTRKGTRVRLPTPPHRPRAVPSWYPRRQLESSDTAQHGAARIATGNTCRSAGQGDLPGASVPPVRMPGCDQPGRHLPGRHGVTPAVPSESLPPARVTVRTGRDAAEPQPARSP